MNWQPRKPRMHAPWMVWWLAIALLLGPTLGQMHEVLHAPKGLVVASNAATTPSVQSAHHRADGVEAWFADHSTLECLALDQLALGHCSPAQWLPMGFGMPTAPAPWQIRAPHAAAAHPMFLARAPPESFMA